ncbi:hypothetical protein EJ02DRAFT_450955 [Clathrospora elynae]|uniref:PHD-type domain-containing protein n=1 Tax=Clathrospora elynae TaxID=706981 RepID=A0A6A5T2N7_9PLEO|nr:hypothetical protein EJ02DRAFT_450955 [Clathrospora elynae]
MRDREDKQASYSASDSSHHGRTYTGAHSSVRGPKSIGHRESRESLSAAISPPPLKRQRTASDYFKSAAHNSCPKSLRRRPNTGPSALRHSFNGHSISFVDQQSRRAHDPAPSWKSYSFPAPPAYREHEHQLSNASSKKSDAPHLDRSSKTAPSTKRACPVCEKTSDTTYNPLIVCPGCERPYHDSCRNPSLIAGVDPHQWRCATCLSSNGTRKGPRKSLGLSLCGHSVDKEIPESRFRKSLGTSSLPVREDIALVSDTGTRSPQVPILGRIVPGNPRPNASESEIIGLSGRPKLNGPERTEVPNTPTQRSSQLDEPKHTAKTGIDEDIVSGTQPHTGSIAALVVLCSVCRKQRVLAKNGNESTKCRSCRNRSLIVEAGKLEIPETPDAAPTQGAKTRSSPDVLVSTPVSAVQTAPAPWFETGLVTSKPKIKKVGDDETPCTFTESHETLIDIDTPVEVSQVADTEGKKTLHKLDDATDRNPLKDHSRMQQSHLGDREKTLPEHSHPRFTTSLVNSRQEPPLTKKPENRRAEECTVLDASLSGQTEPLPPTIPEANELPSATSTTMIFIERAPLHTNPESLPHLGKESTTPPAPPNRHTNRELVRIALVSAGGSPLNALQVLDWLPNNISYLQKGGAAWEGSTKAALSKFPEFRGNKFAGARNLKAYNFMEAKTRLQYQRQYHEYCTTLESLSSRPNKPSPQNHYETATHSTRETECEIRRLKAVKSAPTPMSHTLTTTEPKHTLTSSSNNILGKNSPGDTLFMPFERTTPRQQATTLEYAQETNRETSLFKVFQQFQKPSIDVMTQEGKAKKIAEIRARPSRKKFFGSDHRLAHVRRYGRQDIHDESDGAWKRDPRKVEEKKPRREKDVDMTDRVNTRTLREVFNLPANAIPMNDGQGELAFRDGTLINGRLPRPRHIYRVGKIFGGELTTRLG